MQPQTLQSAARWYEACTPVDQRALRSATATLYKVHAGGKGFSQALASLIPTWERFAPFWRAITGLQRGRYQVHIGGLPNGDHGQFAAIVPPMRLWANSTAELAKLAGHYRDIFDVGAGNWAGGTIFDSSNGNQPVGRICYNGTVRALREGEAAPAAGEEPPIKNVRADRIVELTGPGTPGDPQGYVTELLADLAHYGERHGVDLRAAFADAFRCYSEEREMLADQAEEPSLAA